jgi:phosphate transport system protein
MQRTAFNEGLNVLYGLLLEEEGLIEAMLSDAVKALKTGDLELAKDVVDRDQRVDRLAEGIEAEVVLLIARHQPVGSDLRRMVSAIKNVIDLERVGDLSTNIARAVPEIASQGLLKPLIDIPRMAGIAQEMLKDGITALKDEDMNLAKRVCARDEEMDALHWQIFRELLVFMMQDPKTIGKALPLLFVARHLERVGDHATNIAETVIYNVTGLRRKAKEFEGMTLEG